VRPVAVGETCGDQNVTPVLAGKLDRTRQARQVAVGYEHDRGLDPLGIGDLTDDSRDLGGAAGRWEVALDATTQPCADDCFGYARTSRVSMRKEREIAVDCAGLLRDQQREVARERVTDRSGLYVGPAVVEDTPRVSGVFDLGDRGFPTRVAQMLDGDRSRMRLVYGHTHEFARSRAGAASAERQLCARRLALCLRHDLVNDGQRNCDGHVPRFIVVADEEHDGIVVG
jgi:hypothetical protein